MPIDVWLLVELVLIDRRRLNLFRKEVSTKQIVIRVFVGRIAHN